MWDLIILLEGGFNRWNHQYLLCFMEGASLSRGWRGLQLLMVASQNALKMVSIVWDSLIVLMGRYHLWGEEAVGAGTLHPVSKFRRKVDWVKWQELLTAAGADGYHRKPSKPDENPSLFGGWWWQWRLLPSRHVSLSTKKEMEQWKNHSTRKAQLGHQVYLCSPKVDPVGFG